MPDRSTSRSTNPSRSAFISHASGDAGLAQQLCAQLESQGIRCWIAPRDLKPGEPYSSEIVRGIEGTDALVLLATPAAVESGNVLNELEQAHRFHKTLLTVMVGRPQISRQLSYYIARLHWIEASGSSMEGLADRLAQALQGATAWESIASRPSLGRWLLYGLWRRFLIPAFSTAVVIVVAGLIALHFVRARLATDYRSLGWVTLDGAQDAAAGPISIGARVWIGSKEAALSDVSLQGVLKLKDASIQRIELLGKQNPLRTAEGQAVLLTVPSETSQLTTCLTVPSPKLGAPYRVTQGFSIVASSGIEVDPAGATSVKKEDGSPCGP
jgi:TIR domain